MSDETPIAPFENGDSDRGSDGRFKPGWKGGPGNPRSQHARQLRVRLEEALHKSCSPDRLLAAVDAVLKLAEAGDVAAFKLLCERIAGPPISAEISERLEALETAIEQRANV
jgi:hypothetical protein